MPQFTGLSLIIHLTIIFSATLVGFLRGERYGSAFETRDKKGGIFRSTGLNTAIAYAVLVLINVYMFFLGFMALRTAYVIGADEPHRRFVSFVVDALATSVFTYPLVYMNTIFVILIVATIFMYESISHMFPIRAIHRLVDVLYKIVCSVSSRFARVFRATAVTIVSYFGVAYGRTIGRPFAISLESILVRVVLGLVLSAAFFGLPFYFASAQIVESGFESEEVVSGLSLATAVDFTPDGRIFIAEKNGTIRVVKNGALLGTPLVTLTDVNTFGDRGLLGLAVDPNFETNGYIYISYAYENTPGSNIGGPKTGRIVRLTVVGDIAQESSKFVLVGTVGGVVGAPSCEDYLVTDDCIASDSNSHSVGGLRFGPDEKLYATLGDGSDFADVDPRALRAQNIDALAGKLLRINTDGTGPSDNPYFNGNPNANRSKVYALGLRNAFRFNFNHTTGRLYLGDVGWSTWEEVNLVTGGANFGWPCREGNGTTTYGCAPSSATTDPLYTYPHNVAGAGSITGGAFPSFNAYPDQYDTSLFIGDYAQMWMKRLVLNASGTAVVSVEDFNVDNVWPVEIITGPDGTIYYLDIVMGSLNRLTHTSGNRRPVVTLSADPTSGLIPLEVTFSSVGTYDPDADPLTYAWDFGDGTTSNTPSPSHTYTTNGAYTAYLTVTDMNGAQVTKSLQILVGNQKPTADITSPSSGSLYTELEMLTITGTGTDPETGALPPEAFSWEVILHHNTHVHTLLSVVGSSSITFQADDHNASDVYMEVILTVTDPAGLTDDKHINLYLNNGGGGGNLISNPSVEIEGILSSSPLDWFQGWYGVMAPVFTYPVPGFVGDRAVKVEVLTYESGDAKWYFSPVFVTAGESYTFQNKYTATAPTNVSAQFGRSNGSYEYVSLADLPPVATSTPVTLTFTIPLDVETMTMFHQIGAVGELVVDDYSLTLQGGDVTPPNGAITSPATNTTLSGLATIEVNANDNIGVASVKLLVDGNVTGIPDSESPFSIVWDTTLVPDGMYSIEARLTDTSGNISTTPPLTVEVVNTLAPNLFDNGDFEIASSTNPRSWQPGGWGTHTAVYSYPIPGHTGNGIGITVTNYDFDDTGDARWVHAPIPVVSGTEYTYETWYKATTITDVLGRYRFANGSEHYFGLIKEIPGTSTWTKTSNTFVPPVGAVDVTFGHAISAGGASVQMDDVKLFVSGTGTPSEINVPTIDFISPQNGATLSGTVTLSATSSDDTAVVGVFFAVNGSPVGIEDLTAPYTHVLDTMAYSNGSYILKATTRDPYGNNANKQITVTIHNTAPPATTTNLVLNGTLETPGTPGNPANWNRGGWGTNTRTYTYPATGFSGNGAQVTISGYTNGDAKWYFDPVPVTPGTAYSVSERYNSTIASEMLARYTKTDGSFQYQFLGGIPGTAGAWQNFTATVTPPVGMTHLTLFHVIAGNGSLTIDNVSVEGPGSTSTPPDTTPPTVSVTSPTAGATISGTTTVSVTATDNVGVTEVQLLVDGNVVGSPDTTSPYSFSLDTTLLSNGAHTIAPRAYDAAGNGTAVNIPVTVNNVVTPPATTTNLVLNGTLETPGTPGNPANWNRGGWGTNTRTYTYPATGFSGNGAQVTISGYTNGDAKWYFDPVPVTPGTAYSVSERYNSTIASEMLARYTKTDGSFQYQFLGGIPGTAGAWQNFTATVTPPVGMTHLTLFHVIAGNGSLTIDNVSVEGPGSTTTDTIAPSAMITSPNTATIASGTVTISASATDNVGVAGVTLLVNGNPIGTEDTSAPYSFSWNTESVIDGTYSVSVLARDVAGNTGLSAGIVLIVDNVATSTDNISPVVVVTTPVSGVTVSGLVNVQGTTTDNVGIVGTALFIDGIQDGSENLAVGNNLAFGFEWNTVGLSNGTHSVSVHVRDEAGNIGISSPITVTVNNSTTTPPQGDNLILNSALETPGTGGNPEYWNRGGWGTNDRTFTYPVAGQSGNGAQVSMTTRTNGDAKWFFDEVAITPGSQYTFSYDYTATVQTNLTIRYTNASGTVSYVGIENPPASAGWSTRSIAFVPPAGAVTATVMHILSQVGSLTIDNQTLTTGNPNSFARGKVSFSFDDGWLEHSTIAGPVLDAAGIDGTFYIVSEFMNNSQAGEKVTNGTLETTGAGSDPEGWNRGGWGTNTRTYTYPATGFSGNGAQVTIADYVNGDAKWYVTPISVAPGNEYTVSERYQSTVASELLARFTKTDGSFIYQFLSALPSTGGAWQLYTTSITTQTDVTEMTLFHVIHGNGSLTIDDVSVMQIEAYMSATQIGALHAGGHEIGAHTRTHTSLITLDTTGKTDEISGNRQDLTAAGFGPIDTIAYPYGEFDTEVETITEASGFTLGRSVLRGYNDSTSNPYGLRIQQVGRVRTLEEMKGWIDQAAASKTWLILMFHQISNDTSDTFGITSSDFEALVDHASSADVDIITVRDGAPLLQ